MSSVLGRDADRNDIRSLVSSVIWRSELLLRRSGGGGGGASVWAESLLSPRAARMGTGNSSGGGIAAKVLLYDVVLDWRHRYCFVIYVIAGDARL